MTKYSRELVILCQNGAQMAGAEQTIGRTCENLHNYDQSEISAIFF
jgi:hypothetical protein